MPFFWLDVGAYTLSAIMALAMTMAVLVTGPRRRLYQAFSFYTLATGTTALLAVLLRLSLWMEHGDPELLGELATWTFAFIGPALLLFAAYYVGISARGVYYAAAAGIVWACFWLLPALLGGRVVHSHVLDAQGTTHVTFTTLGLVSALVPSAFLVWALVLFLRFHEHVQDRYIAISTIALLAGISIGGVLDAPFPILSFAMGTSLGILALGILKLQLFNPLRERNLALQVEIAERKRAEAEILHLQHVLQAVTNSMPAALITLDLDGRVLTWNPAAETLTGVPDTATLGKNVWETCPGLGRYRDLVDSVAADRVPVRLSEETSDPGPRAVRDVEAFPLISNGIRGIVLRIRDVTRRVEMEAVALQSAKMASVGGLAAGMAHELNNPLGAMLQGLQVLDLAIDVDLPLTRARLMAQGVDPEALKRYIASRDLSVYIDQMRRSGERAARIVSDLLAYSRKSTFQRSTCDINQLVRSTLELAATDFDLRRRYDFRDIAIRWELATDLPQFVCDGPQIQQVILNLVRNAAQAMASRVRSPEAQRPPEDTPEGAGMAANETSTEYEPQLVLRTLRSPGGVRLEVCDNGPGLSGAARAHLFEPFNTTKDVGEGTGLGLWLCWTIIVERHHGRIWAESEHKQGTCVIVELPTGADTAREAV